MLFSSMVFLWIFLPIVFIVNFALNFVPFKKQRDRIKVKNIFLLVSSLVFYAWGGFYYLFIMIASILVNYFAGRLICIPNMTKSRQRTVVILTVIINLLILFFFKYFNMLVVVLENLIDPGKGSIIRMVGTGVLGLKEIVLPIGISFFTFQALSYVIDVYKDNSLMQRNLPNFALYVSFFPQLIAGPIVKYSDVARQIDHRKETLSRTVSGIKRFCYGLGKKVLLANTFAETADSIYALGSGEIIGSVAWLFTICYTLQIYFDFSGYSDMAIGLGRMFGFDFKENFNYPYTSLSIKEFWRRWHISLSSWFRDYVYIPLGGNRKGKGRTLINLMIVFLLTGFWHGANFTFIAWGIYYGIFLIIERLFLGKWLEKNKFKPLNYIYTILVVMIGWIMFRADNIVSAMDIIGGLFKSAEGIPKTLEFMSLKLIICLIAGILLCGPVQRLLKRKYEAHANGPVVRKLDFACQLVLLFFSILSLVSSSYNPFIYFQF